MYHEGMVSTNFFIFQFQQNWMDLVNNLVVNNGSLSIYSFKKKDKKWKTNLQKIII